MIWKPLIGLATLLIASTQPACATPSDQPTTEAANETSQSKVDQTRSSTIADQTGAAQSESKPESQKDISEQHLALERQSAKAATDSADAAWSTYYLSLFLGSFTLAAAAIAAYYTGRSAHHARKNIDAIYEAERAILHADGGDVGFSKLRDELLVTIEFINRGRAFAQIIEFGAAKDVNGGGPNSAKRWTFIGPGEVGSVPAFPAPAKGTVAVIDCWIKYRSVGPAVYQSHFTVTARYRNESHPSGMAGFIGWHVDVSNERGHPDDT